MDIPREKKTDRRRFLYIGAAIVAVVLATVGLSRLRPAAPSVQGAWQDTVELGPMVREVRGPGSLVPEQIRWVVAVAPGRVDRKLVEPGAQVTANTILLELSNPDVQIQLLQAERQLTDAQAQLVALRTTLETQRLNQEGVTAQIKADYQDALRKAAADSSLTAQGLISTSEGARSRDQAEQFTTRLKVEQQRLQIYTETMQAQLDVQQQQIQRLRDVVEFQRSLSDAMVVRAGSDGVLQELPLEQGQWAISGALLAKVVQPRRLKAVLRVPETQAPDVALGQSTVVDTRNGLVKGHVMRINPASTGGTVTVDVALDDSLPRGVRPDQSVDGTIEIERLDRVLHVGRPAFAQPNATITLFRMVPGSNEAERVQVQLGRTSVNTIEIVGGLNEGDVVILSDMSRYDAVDRVRVK